MQLKAGIPHVSIHLIFAKWIHRFLVAYLIKLNLYLVCSLKGLTFDFLGFFFQERAKLTILYESSKK